MSLPHPQTEGDRKIWHRISPADLELVTYKLSKEWRAHQAGEVVNQAMMWMNGFNPNDPSYIEEINTLVASFGSVKMQTPSEIRKRETQLIKYKQAELLQQRVVRKEMEKLAKYRVRLRK